MLLNWILNMGFKTFVLSFSTFRNPAYNPSKSFKTTCLKHFRKYKPLKTIFNDGLHHIWSYYTLLKINFDVWECGCPPLSLPCRFFCAFFFMKVSLSAPKSALPFCCDLFDILECSKSRFEVFKREISRFATICAKNHGKMSIECRVTAISFRK